MQLFTERSIWTMIHGVVLGSLALLALFAALFHLHVVRTGNGTLPSTPAQSRSFASLTVIAAVALWLAVLLGTYIIFPPYRLTPPEGVIDLAPYPRAMLLGNPETAWLHAFAMEIKEHVPWIAAMIATAVAFVAARYRTRLLDDPELRGMAMWLLGICFGLVSIGALLGTFINKVAPLE